MRPGTSSGSPVPVTLCADDYGFAPGIGVAIRDLIGRRRLTATGCMTAEPHWPAEAPLLKRLGDGFDAGLHLVLTDRAPAGAMPGLAPEGVLPPLGRLILLAHRRRLDGSEIAAEIHRQIDRFEEAFGRPPDFVDGHKHVHQLPVIRDALAAVHAERLGRSGARVRYCTQPLSRLFGAGTAGARAAVIGLLGLAWSRQGRAAGIPGNRGFLGVRSFAEAVPYRELMRVWLGDACPGTLIMCHPGHVDEFLTAADPVGAEREEEYGFLASDPFAEMLEEHAIALVRFRDLPTV